MQARLALHLTRCSGFIHCAPLISLLSLLSISLFRPPLSPPIPRVRSDLRAIFDQLDVTHTGTLDISGPACSTGISIALTHVYAYHDADTAIHALTRNITCPLRGHPMPPPCPPILPLLFPPCRCQNSPSMHRTCWRLCAREARGRSESQGEKQGVRGYRYNGICRQGPSGIRGTTRCLQAWERVAATAATPTFLRPRRYACNMPPSCLCSVMLVDSMPPLDGINRGAKCGARVCAQGCERGAVTPVLR